MCYVVKCLCLEGLVYLTNSNWCLAIATKMQINSNVKVDTWILKCTGAIIHLNFN